MGIGLSALGLAGPVFALIEQPTYGFSDPIVWVPLVGGIACFGAFVWWETPRARADAAAGAVSLAQLQRPSTWRPCASTRRSAGPSSSSPCSCSRSPATRAFQAGRGDHPGDDADVPALGPLRRARRRGSARGCRWAIGPLIGARRPRAADPARAPTPNYLTDVLPAMLLFGLGLSMTVAPLTTTVLDSVEERHVGVASGVNNAVARVAQVLAIAVLGAVVSAQFASSLDDRTARAASSAPRRRRRSTTPKEQPLVRRRRRRRARRPRRRRSTPTSPRLVGVGLPPRDAGSARALMALGGVIALARRPQPGARPADREQLPRPRRRRRPRASAAAARRPAAPSREQARAEPAPA